jgi:hypothetical protein
MKKNTKIIAVSLGLIGFGMYFFYKQGKQSGLANENPENEKADWDKLLKKGSQGKEVVILQEALKGLVADGDFGSLTEARLKKVTGATQTTLNQYNDFFKKQS